MITLRPRVADPVGLDPVGRRVGVRRFRAFGAIFLVYLGYAVPDLWARSTPSRVLGFMLLALFIVLYLGVLPMVTFRGARQSRAGILVAVGMLAIMVVYLVVIGPEGLLLVTYLAVALVVALPRFIAGVCLVVMCLATAFGPQFVHSWHLHGGQWVLAGSALLIGVAMSGVRANTAQTIALHQARQEVARLATEQERLRIARDLHDLLGHALTAVTVKAELAARLAPRDPVRAAAEMTEVAELSRQGLADVRAAVAGFREVSLVTELATARSVLRSAGIAADLPAAVERVPVELRELFGWVVREGITNVVRHSRASHVTVHLEERAIEIVDDGGGPGEPRTGHGLTGLRERVAAIHGSVLSGPVHAEAPFGFRLRVEAPR